MATFTEAQVSDLAEILGTNSDYLDDHLDYYESLITESDKAKVVQRITEWQAIDGNFVSAEPNVRNFGGRYSPGQHRNQIAIWIARLIQFPYSAGVAQTTLIRG